uniref:semaphorin-5A-like n=1 Tax=Myxine glutinosa TaxID=7769 RepID=UPI00358E6490
MGIAQEERLCHSIQDCPASRVWSTWGPWDHCSSPCGGGVHTRRRICSHIGSCHGCDVECKACNDQPCTDAMVATPWGQWMTENSLFQQRWRHTCLAENMNYGSLKLGPRQVEMRFCSNKTRGASCPPNTELQFEAKLEPGWSSWSLWESCSRTCGLGFRVRRRYCTPVPTRHLTPACLGPSTQYGECRLKLCAGEGGWTCWSAWSDCSGPCSLSFKTRSRHCTIAEDSRLCAGPPKEKESCRMQGCPGDWNTWASWSRCDGQTQQHRTRVCTTTSQPPEQCMGTASESRQCTHHPNAIPDNSIDLSARLATAHGGFTLGHVVAASLSCGLAACLLTVFTLSICQAKIPSLTTHSGTPVTSIFSRNSSCPCRNRNQAYTLKGYHDVRREEIHSSLESKLNTSPSEAPAGDTTSDM